MENLPERIFLNLGFENYDSDPVDFKKLSGVTWSEDRIDDCDIEYVVRTKLEEKESALAASERFRIEDGMSHINEANELRQQLSLSKERCGQLEEALKDLVERANRCRNILQTTESANKGYWGILDTEKQSLLLTK